MRAILITSPNVYQQSDIMSRAAYLPRPCFNNKDGSEQGFFSSSRMKVEFRTDYFLADRYHEAHATDGVIEETRFVVRRRLFQHPPDRRRILRRFAHHEQETAAASAPAGHPAPSGANPASASAALARANWLTGFR
jgi:hypothetical protein